MKQLHHNGVLVTPQYEGKGLVVKVKTVTVRLTPEQEEMAFAWAKKIGTPYVEDRVFAQNFHNDLSKKLGIKAKPGEVDYSEIFSIIEKERNQKANLSREEKKQLAAERKVLREKNKERYGYAWVDGVQTELANYAVEPNSIFMGRGKHPLRGRWKKGPRVEDIELNLSPDAPRPPGKWKAIMWRPNDMWIARWKDKLTGKMKYVWFSDSSILKQKKDVEKFDKAMELRQNLAKVQRHILRNLDAKDLRRRKIATVSFLINRLKIRVGDEKDPDEADTVGASTLRPEHIYINGDGTVTFNFLGKDSIPHTFRVKLPNTVIENLKDFAANAKSTLFDGIRSQHVSDFLDEVMTGLSAKVFRTCYASEATEKKLKNADARLEDPDYVKKYAATMANLEAAKVCNHRRTIPKSWKSSLEKKKDRLKTLKGREKEMQLRLRKKVEEQEKRYEEKLGKQEEMIAATIAKLEAYRQKLQERKPKEKSFSALKRRIVLQQQALSKKRQRLKLLKIKHMERMKKLERKRKNRRQLDRNAIDKLKLKLRIQTETRDYNLATSLKSYIDPRIYNRWGKQIDYDWKRYYSKTLQKKFMWVETAAI
jgi:DNA topoisomerase-1